MNITKIFFNPNTNECDLFSYSGCGGNANNFMSVRECESKCKKRSSIPVTNAPAPVVVKEDVKMTPNKEPVVMSIAPILSNTAKSTNDTDSGKPSNGEDITIDKDTAINKEKELESEEIAAAETKKFLKELFTAETVDEFLLTGHPSGLAPT